MFGRRRNSGVSDVLPNSTNYQEKTVFTTDGGAPAPDYAPQSPYGSPYQSAPYAGDAGTVTEMRPIQSATKTEPLPMVFASREHEDVYIYEYPDRFEYYIRMATRMYLFNTVKR